MSFIADIANMIFLIAAVVAGVLALVYHNRYSGVADRLSQIEADLEAQKGKEAALNSELAQRRKEIDRLSSLAQSAGVERSKLEAAQVEPPRGSKADKKKADAKLQRDLQRMRELESQVDEARRQLENAQKLIKTRDADVRSLKDEIEALQMALAEHAPAPTGPRGGRHDDEEDALRLEEAPVAQKAAPVTPPPPEVDIEALVDARTLDARKQVEAAERANREAQGRANLAELEARRSQERLSRLDKRSHELLDRLLATEREMRKVSRQVKDYERMYLGLKGRFEVARDTLVTFRDRFNVEIPTEVGVPLHGPIEEFLELEDDDERSARPRGDNRPRGERRPTPASGARSETSAPAAPDADTPGDSSGEPANAEVIVQSEA